MAAAAATVRLPAPTPPPLADRTREIRSRRCRLHCTLRDGGCRRLHLSSRRLRARDFRCVSAYTSTLQGAAGWRRLPHADMPTTRANAATRARAVALRALVRRRHVWAALAAALASSCTQDFDSFTVRSDGTGARTGAGGTVGTGGTQGVGASAGSGGTLGGGTGGAGGSGASCGPASAAPGSASCPAVCTRCTQDNVCVIDCSGEATCDRATHDCPPNYACHVICSGVDACNEATINCPDVYVCSVVCEGSDGCGDLALNCGDGPCTIECAADACQVADVYCGSGPCQAACNGTPIPELHGCLSACNCTRC
jgi:hypothetical protein